MTYVYWSAIISMNSLIDKTFSLLIAYFCVYYASPYSLKEIRMLIVICNEIYTMKLFKLWCTLHIAEEFLKNTF